MARDPLRILLSVRLNAVEQARVALGVCLRAEAEIAERIRQIEAAGQRHSAATASWREAHQFQEMTALRLAALRAERQAAAVALAEAAARSAAARGAVTAARSAAEAVEQLADERDAARTAELARKRQHELDDIVRAQRMAQQRDAAG